MNEQPSDDDRRDAHLLAALRHAPDRDALPPREVSARILAAARAAVRPVPAAPWWQRVGAWLVQPQVAASFGTLAVASIVGLMWSTREPPLDEPALRQSAAEPAAATSAAAAATAAPAVTAPSELRHEERDLSAQTTPATPTPKHETAPRRAKEAKAPAAKADALPAPAAPAAAPPAARREDTRAADAAVTAGAADSAQAANSADTADIAKASRPRAAAASARESSSLQALTAAGSAGALADSLARAEALLAGGGATWSNAGRELLHGPAQAAWWAQLRRVTAGAWQPAPPTRTDASSPAALTLRAAGQATASIDFADDSVGWCPSDRNACWRAPISAAQREAWSAEIASW